MLHWNWLDSWFRESVPFSHQRKYGLAKQRHAGQRSAPSKPPPGIANSKDPESAPSEKGAHMAANGNGFCATTSCERTLTDSQVGHRNAADACLFGGSFSGALTMLASSSFFAEAEGFDASFFGLDVSA
jgi:hypothetical protein